MPEREPILSAEQSEIEREISKVHKEAYGTEVYNVQVTVTETFVCIVMDIELAANEITLIGAGKAESVKVTREAFQEAIQPTFEGIIERATGRRVCGFASRTILDDESWSTEIFRLSPRA